MSRKLLKPQKYLVLYLDFLGQKEFFKRITDLEPGDEIKEKLTLVSDSARRAIGGAKLLSEALEKNAGAIFADLSRRGVHPYCEAPLEWFKYEMNCSRAGIQQFSDGTMIHIPLNDDIIPVVLPSWMFAICRLFLRCVYDGALPRGGMTIGEGLETEEGILYGPVVDRVGHLEGAVARYPRIVISDDLFDYMDRISVDCIAPHPLKMVEVDADGSYILNYLSLDFLQCPIHGEEKDACWQHVRYLHWFVRNELGRHRNQGDGELFRRYRMWDAYSLRHEKELSKEGVLLKDELIERPPAKKLGRYVLGKYLIFYLQVQPDPFSRLGYGTDPDEVNYLKEICQDMREVHARLKQNFPSIMGEMFGDNELERTKAIQDVENTSCGVAQMSNYIMFYAQNQGSSAGHFLDAWLLQMKGLLRAYAARGIFVRGGLDYGIGWELEANVLYGPVIRDVSIMESQIAVYPRIVVSESIQNELEEARASFSAEGKCADDELLVFDYLAKDEDGVLIFDYLNVDEDPSDKVKFDRAQKWIAAGRDMAHKACQWALKAYRKHGVVNPDRMWPMLSLEMYFRRKYEEWVEKSAGMG